MQKSKKSEILANSRSMKKIISTEFFDANTLTKYFLSATGFCIGS